LPETALRRSVGPGAEGVGGGGGCGGCSVTGARLPGDG
jgi:hypothetical protein